jgi:hypothetical protein
LFDVRAFTKLSSIYPFYIYFGSAFQGNSSSLEEAVRTQSDINKSLGRSQPFILRMNSSYFVIADGAAILVKPATLSVALDMLLKCFFVFNVDYPRQTLVVHNFLQHSVLCVKGDLSAKANKLFSELDI